MTNDITLSYEDLYKSDITASEPHIIYDKYKNLTEFHCKCKIRHSKTEYDAFVKNDGDKFIIEFKDLARAPSPGQSAVFYEENFVIGGGFIEN